MDLHAGDVAHINVFDEMLDFKKVYASIEADFELIQTDLGSAWADDVGKLASTIRWLTNNTKTNHKIKQ